MQNIDKLIEESDALCRNVIHKYYNFLSGRDILPLDGIHQNSVSMQTNEDKTVSLSFDLVDQSFRYKYEELDEHIRIKISAMIQQLKMFAKYVLEAEIDDSTMPSILRNGIIQGTPHATLFLYNRDHGRRILNMSKLIGIKVSINDSL